MKIYNTLSRKKEDFKPIVDNEARIYLCGPTVYDFGHLGHGRSAVAFDVLRRFFLYQNLNVRFVSNYTDIDDKMINRASMMKISVAELAEKIIPEYKKDYSDLNIMPADINPKATEFIAEILGIIKKLEEKGYTYVISDGVYYDVSRFKDYGKLSRQKLDELQAGARVELNQEKRNPQDFVLWKFYKEGEPFWESPWGNGRPGWHIECSAMSWKLLGETFDIHAGGADLIFPHHECEIAQSEATFDKPFAKYWMHNGFIEINKEKMSKSLGNFFTLRDIFKEFRPLAVRLMFLQTHYRSPIEFSKELLKQAENALDRVNDFMARVHNYKPNSDKSTLNDEFITGIRSRFEDCLNDDLETPGALAAFFDLIKETNRLIDAGTLSDEDKQIVLALMVKMDSVLGIIRAETEGVDNEVMNLIKEREDSRKNKDWKRADEIRKLLLDKGIILDDTPDGTIWKRSR